MKRENVPLTVIRRLPRYYRYLGDLLKSGCTRISSKELSERMHVTASQIRQDLNCFGGFGQQGYGYNVEALYREIGDILFINNTCDAFLVGVGHLGTALVNHLDFGLMGVRLTGLFDINPEVVGTRIHGIRVAHIDEAAEHIERLKPQIAILTLPKSETLPVFSLFVKHGIKGFWNFSNMEIVPPEDVVVENVHLSDSLMTLRYRVFQQQ